MSRIACCGDNRRAGPRAGLCTAVLLVGLAAAMPSAPEAKEPFFALAQVDTAPARDSNIPDEDAADNPDQGAGWQIPGTAGKKRPDPDPATERWVPPHAGEPEKPDEDAADNPDQGAGWQIPTPDRRR